MRAIPESAPTQDSSRNGNLGQFAAAYQRLTQRIVNGVYAPRQHLVETDVARELAVSRATVRAILIRLQQDGLVEIQPNRGARVRAFTLDEAVRLLQVREVLEGLAASLAARQATPAQLTALRDTVGEMDRALAGGDLLAYSSMNARFHRVILDAAAHEFIDQIVGSLHYPLVRYQFRTILVPGRTDESLAEHREILACLERRDAAGAERAARAHVAQVRATLQRSGELPL
jgi:DNA-binding GntR family transcriptional regulator